MLACFLENDLAEILGRFVAAFFGNFINLQVGFFQKLYSSLNPVLAEKFVHRVAGVFFEYHTQAVRGKPYGLSDVCSCEIPIEVVLFDKLDGLFHSGGKIQVRALGPDKDALMKGIKTPFQKMLRRGGIQELSRNQGIVAVYFHQGTKLLIKIFNGKKVIISGARGDIFLDQEKILLFMLLIKHKGICGLRECNGAAPYPEGIALFLREKACGTLPEYPCGLQRL